MKRKHLRLKFRHATRKAKGQSLVEFALVSIFLFMMIFGVIEMGRFLYVYSAVSNAAQEGSRYGIIRPRDLYNVEEAQWRTSQGTAVPTGVVVPNGACNIVDKTREKVVGIPRSAVNVNIWYDNGNGTPTAVPSSSEALRVVSAPGGINRISVEATYTYHFLTPFFSMFAPNGITVRMRSARTILRPGDEVYTCAVSYTPAPSRTATGTPTRTPTRTATATNTMTPTRTATRTNTPVNTPTNTATRTATSTMTATPTATPTPGLMISLVDARKPTGNNQNVNVKVYVTNLTGQPLTGATVQVTVRNCNVTPCASSGPFTIGSIGGGYYRACPVSGSYSGDPALYTVLVQASSAGYGLVSGTYPVTNSSVCPP